MLKILLILLANESTARFVRRNEQLNQCSKEIQKKCASCSSYHYPLFNCFGRNHLLDKFIFARIAQ